MMTTVEEVNCNKAKVPDEFNFHSAYLIVFLLNSMSKLIHSQCKLTCKLKNVNKFIWLLTSMQTNNWVASGLGNTVE